MALDFTRLREIVSALAPDGDMTDFDGEVGALSEVSAGADARIDELTSQLADAEDRYKATAAKNYELMLAATDKPADEPEPEDGEGGDDYDVETLFGEE